MLLSTTPLCLAPYFVPRLCNWQKLILTCHKCTWTMRFRPCTIDCLNRACDVIHVAFLNLTLIVWQDCDNLELSSSVNGVQKITWLFIYHGLLYVQETNVEIVLVIVELWIKCVQGTADRWLWSTILRVRSLPKELLISLNTHAERNTCTHT